MIKIIKVIDLLNTPLDKLPKKIKIEDTIYNLLIDEDNLIYYQNEECKYFMYSISCFNELNEEVEIIEEKEMCHRCGKYPAEYNQTWCEFCLGISEEDKEIKKLGYFDLCKSNEDGDLQLTYTGVADTFDEVYEKINELVKTVNELKKEGNK